MRRIGAILVLLSIFFGNSMPYAFAQRGFERGREAPAAVRLVPLNQVIAGVSRQFSGRVLDANMGNGRSPVYNLKVLTGDGNVLAVTVDAQSGRVLSVRGRR